MNYLDLRKNINTRIASGETALAINIFMEVEEFLQQEVREEIYIISAQFKTYCKEKKLGLHSPRHNDEKLNRINYQLVQLSSKLKETTPEKSGELANKKLVRITTPLKAIFLCILFIVLGIILIPKKEKVSFSKRNDIFSQEPEEQNQSKAPYLTSPTDKLGNKKDKTQTPSQSNKKAINKRVKDIKHLTDSLTENFVPSEDLQPNEPKITKRFEVLIPADNIKSLEAKGEIINPKLSGIGYTIYDLDSGVYEVSIFIGGESGSFHRSKVEVNKDSLQFWPVRDNKILTIPSSKFKQP